MGKINSGKIPEQILKIITDNHLKHIDVATAAGYTRQQFSDMLHGRRQIRATDIPQIAKALGVSINQLYGVGDVEIHVIKEDGELVASIAEGNIIEKTGYKVICVPACA